MKLFVDLDGVLADFDSGYHAAFGIRPSIHSDNVDWDLVRGQKDFYLDLPPMSDFEELWEFIQPLKPTVLTGVPWSVEEACANKTAWVRKYLGDTPIQCCRSSEKCQRAEPGAVLIDDWEKYKHKWEKAGGIWVTHRSAVETIQQLEATLAR